MKFAVLILALVLLQQAYCDELVQIQVLFRHGARTPIFCNWYCEHWKTTNEWGYLTPIGMRQHYVLGQWFRERYIINQTFLNATFDQNEIRILSTDVNRTIQSALSDFYGMYPLGVGPLIPGVPDERLLPPVKEARTPLELGLNATPSLYQPIPIHIRPESEDILMKSYGYPTCPNANSFEELNQQTPVWLKVNNYSQPLIEQFAKEMNLSSTNLTIADLSNYYDTFISHLWNDFPMPSSLSNDTIAKMDWLNIFAISAKLYQTPDQYRPMSTPFLSNIISNFQQKLDNKQKYKMHVYSAHDTTILLMLNALNLTSADCLAQVYMYENVNQTNCIYTYPGYASNLIFELYTSANGPYVKVVHNGTQIALNNTMNLPFDTFTTLLQGGFQDFNTGCGVQTNSLIVVEKSVPTWAWVVIVILAVLTIGLAVFACYLNGKRRTDTHETLV